MTDNEALLAILQELQALNVSQDAYLLLLDDQINLIAGGLISLVVIFGIDTWFPK